MRKVINIPDKDRDIVPFIDSQINISQYIVRLIRNDMQGGKMLTKIEVIKLIQEYTNTGDIIKNELAINSQVTNSVLDMLDM